MIQPFSPTFWPRLLSVIHPLGDILLESDTESIDAFDDHGVIDVIKQRGVVWTIPKTNGGRHKSLAFAVFVD
ncbi:hypothetical protein D1872_336830 [compost metagenome]